MAIQPVPALLLLLLALLLSPHSRMEPTETAPTLALALAPASAPTRPWALVGNSSAGQPLSGFEFKAAAPAPRPAPGPLALRCPLIPLALWLVLG